jgi:predicted phage terminase large subunit-like protein
MNNSHKSLVLEKQPSAKTDVVSAAEELLRRRQARTSLIAFCSYTLPEFTNPAHQVLLASKLEAVERGEIKNLIVTLPPRHLKSETCSIRFPAWYLGRNPQRAIIGCSYSDNKAYTFSYAVRETLMSQRYQRLWPLKLQTTGAMHWQLTGKNDLRPSYIAAGVGGGITGEGADLLIIDDPVKNFEEANSETVRESMWSWYTTVALTRLQRDSAKIVIMTRWHKDDLVGRLLKVAEGNPKADQWEVLHFKAISDKGEALWPEKFPVDYLEKIRAGQIADPEMPGAGSRAFEALYQGSPVNAEGNIVNRNWWKFYDSRPESFKRIIHSWDTAFKTKAENDYSVCSVWGETDHGYYLLDLWRRKVEYPELKSSAINLYNRDKAQSVLVEDKASGQSLIQELRRDTSLPLLAVKVDTDKIARVYAITPLIESGRVFLPRSAPWLHDFMEEISAFPNGEHDDIVDSLSQALKYMTNNSFSTWDALLHKKIDIQNQERLNGNN